MAGSIYSWSTTATDNDDADGDISWAEGMNSKKVNDSSRQMMGRLAEWLLDVGGQGTVGGTANVITLTLESSFTALKSGLICALQPTADNTAAVTLNVNGIGAKSIRKFDTTGEVSLASGDLQDGNFYLLIYDGSANSSAGAWIILNPTPAVYQASSSKLTDIAALAVTDGNIIVGNGTTWVAESGATARASLGLGDSATKSVGTAAGTVAAGDDSRITGAMPKSGGTFTGDVTLKADPDSALKPATKQYVDARTGVPNAVLEDQKSSGTNGGTFTSGAWQTRDLNTEVRDPDGLITLSSNEFTPSVAGWVEWEAPAFMVNVHQTRLYNVTDSSVAGYGANARSASGDATQTLSVGCCAVVAGKAYRLEHRCSQTQSSTGFAQANSFGGAEVYSRVKFWRA